jgi:hypothetical protein
MALRTYLQDPPIGTDMVNAGRRVSSAWQVWFGYIARQIGKPMIIDVTADPPSLNSLERVSATVVLPGAEVGDFAIASFVPMNSDIGISAAVTATNTVVVWFINYGTGTVDLGSGILRVRLEKKA